MSIPKSKTAILIVEVHIDDADLLMKIFHDSNIPGIMKIYKKPITVEIKDIG